MRSLLAVLLLPLLCAQDPKPTPAEIRAIAERAYVYAYPLVLMAATRDTALVRTPPNAFLHAPQFPDSRFRQVIRPNADTLYSSAWIDLSKEPLILQVPDTHDRYYLLQFMDAWTETFAIPGKRTTGTGEGLFAIVGPGWKGQLPARAQKLESPTNMVWLIGRTQTNGAVDYPNVHDIQKGFVLMPLSLYPDGVRARQPYTPAVPSRAGTPPAQVRSLEPLEFFRDFSELLKTNAPHSADRDMVRDLARIGIVPGRDFDQTRLGPDGIQALEMGARAASARLEQLDGAIGKHGPTNWSGGGRKVGRYGTDYAARAAVARIGLGANPPEDAVYLHCQQDAAGAPLSGANRYRMHFAKSSTPPVKAFWSITMYSQDGYFVANRINRYTIGDRDPLKFNPDGSLDLYIQTEKPAVESNWLPAPSTPFNLSLRLYWPGEEILSGKWIPPAVTLEK